MRHVPHLYLPGPWADVTIETSPATTSHLRTVLRMDVDAPVSYTDGTGTDGEGTWTGAGVLRGPERAVPRPEPMVSLAVAPPRSKDRQRFVVEKLQELAVTRLTWLTTERSQARPPRPDRALAWAVGALEQSRGAWLLQVGSGALADVEAPLVLAADADIALADLDVGERTLVIGPEGGLSLHEAASHPSARLASTVLRTETAAVVAAGILRSR